MMVKLRRYKALCSVGLSLQPQTQDEENWNQHLHTLYVIFSCMPDACTMNILYSESIPFCFCIKLFLDPRIMIECNAIVTSRAEMGCTCERETYAMAANLGINKWAKKACVLLESW